MARIGDDISLEGFPELISKLEKVIAKGGPETVEPILKRGADIMADKVRSLAKVGSTGNLRASVVSKVLKRSGDNPAPAITAIDYRKGPHAHLLEYGTSKMAARPFFRPGIEGSSDQALEVVITKLQQEIEAAFE